jgi:hypothetical protein
LKYSKTDCKGTVKRSDIKIEKGQGILNLLFSPLKQRKINFQDNKSEIFSVVFAVKNKVCSGTTSIHTNFKGLDTNETVCSNDSKINIKGNPGVDNCKLRALTSAQGNISPDFDPNVFNYTMEVPAETQDVDLNVTPASEDLSVKISRRKLAAAGKSTDIKITVSNKNLKTKSVYNVEVKRMPKGEKGPKTRAGKEKSKSNGAKDKAEDKSKGKSKSKSRNKKNGKSAKYDCTDTDSEDDTEELESGNAEPENSSGTLAFENSPYKIYLIGALCLLAAGTSTYFIIKFVKFKRNLSEKPNDSINNSLKK